MEHNTKHNEPYVDLHAVLQHFSIARSKLEKLIREGLPMLRIGKSRRFRVTEVEEWLKAKQEGQHEG
jgi:excisionase family DNA binding protein